MDQVRLRVRHLLVSANTSALMESHDVAVLFAILHGPPDQEIVAHEAAIRVAQLGADVASQAVM